MTTDEHYQAELIRHLLAIDSPKAMNAALASLLTPAEYQEISKRLQIFKLLSEGVPQNCRNPGRGHRYGFTGFPRAYHVTLFKPFFTE